jgi:hypothetical protein
MEQSQIVKQDNDKKIVPWFINKNINPDKQAFIKAYENKDHQEAVKDLLLPAVYHVGEIIHSENKPPQVRLQAAQIIINKCISDKIDIVQQKQVVDINKLIDQAMVLSQLSRQDTTRDITPTDNNDKDIK